MKASEAKEIAIMAPFRAIFNQIKDAAERGKTYLYPDDLNIDRKAGILLEELGYKIEYANFFNEYRVIKISWEE